MKSGNKAIYIVVAFCVFLGLIGKYVKDSAGKYISTSSTEEELKEIDGDDMIYDRKPGINNEHNEEYLIPMDIYFSDAWQAQLAYGRILEYFGEYAMRITENIDFSKYPDKPDYGNSFAGAYLGEDNHLVVLIAHEERTTEYNMAKDELMKAATPTTVGFIPVINFKPVKYSYTYLHSVQDELGIILDKNSENKTSAWKKITGYGISDSQNCVVIDVDYNKGPELDEAFILSEINNDIGHLNNAVKIEIHIPVNEDKSLSSDSLDTKIQLGVSIFIILLLFI